STGPPRGTLRHARPTVVDRQRTHVTDPARALPHPVESARLAVWTTPDTASRALSTWEAGTGSRRESGHRSRANRCCSGEVRLQAPGEPLLVPRPAPATAPQEPVGHLGARERPHHVDDPLARPPLRQPVRLLEHRHH